MEEVSTVEPGALRGSEITMGYGTDVRDFGADPGRVKDSSAALSNAFIKAAETTGQLYLPLGMYRVENPIWWYGTKRVDILAEGAILCCEKFPVAAAAMPAVTYGGFQRGKIRGLSIDGLGGTTHADRVGLRVQNIKWATLDCEYVQNFKSGVQLLAYGGGFAYNRFTFWISGCKYALQSTITGPNVVSMNCLSFSHCKFDATDGMILLDGDPYPATRGAWTFDHPYFETASKKVQVFRGNGLIDNVVLDAPFVESTYDPVTKQYYAIPLGFEPGCYCNNILIRRGGGTLEHLSILWLPKNLRIE